MGAPKAKATSLTKAGPASLVKNGAWDFATIFNAPIEKLSTQQITGAWLLVDMMSDVTKDRKEALRAALLEEAEKRGVTTEKGHYVLEVDGSEVIREKREGKTPDEKGVKALLEKYHLARTECFDEVVHVELNLSKLESLVETGKLPKSEVDALKKTTWALKVKPDDETEKDLDNIRAGLGKEKPAKKIKAVKG